MAKFEIFEVATSKSLGSFSGAHQGDALEACARAQGHENYATMCSKGLGGARLRVQVLAAPEPRAPRKCRRCGQREPHVGFTTGPGGACDDCF